MTRSPGRSAAGASRPSRARRALAALTLALLAARPAAQAVEDLPARPRLVLQITVDGLRADLLDRSRHQLRRDGLARLLRQGVVFRDAHHEHANTETIVGHATLATGASPSVHGMVGNAWFDRSSGAFVYNIEDAEHPLVPTREGERDGAQIDPAQALARSDGRSPRAMLAPTLGDTLALGTAGRAKVFGVSGKDRSAVAMAGHAGTAYWFSTDTADFVTSTYYAPDGYPEWVAAWNARRPAEAYAGTSWELARPREEYLLGDRDDRPYEADLKGYGRTFPHPFPAADDPLFATKLLVSPMGDTLLLDFAKTLLESEGLGQDEVTDYLSVSFSGVDAVNHFFGPMSLENEDALLRLDGTVAELLAFVDRTVGPGRTLVVLSADHGMADMAEAAAEQGIAAGRLSGDEVRERAEAACARLFGDAALVKAFFRPYLTLDAERLAAAELDADAVAAALAPELESHPGIARAVTRRQAADARDGPLDLVRRNDHPERSGDLYLIQAPYWFLLESGPIVDMHGSPWRYDTHVPVVFAGAGLRPAVVGRRVRTMDVAPTLAALLGLTAPAGAEGDVLAEVLDAWRR